MVFCIACDDQEGEVSLFMHPRHLDSMFFDITAIPVKDEFKICSSCIVELKNAYNFKKRCLEIHKLFEKRELMLNKQQNVKKIEDVENFMATDPIDPIEIQMKVEETLQEEELDSNDSYQDDDYHPEEDEDEENCVNFVDNDFQIDIKPPTDLPEPTVTAEPLPPQFTCHICPKAFRKRSLLTNHINYHLNQRDFACPCCSKCFVEGKSLMRHCRNVHDMAGPELTNIKEKIKFEQLEKLKQQKSETSKTVDTKQKFTCEICNKKYLSIKYLQEHKILQHLGSAPYSCPVCGRGFLNLTLLAKHKKYHTNERNFHCPIARCSKTFVERKSFNNHLKKTHQLSAEEIAEMKTDPNGSDSKLMCELCSRTFPSLQLLGNHLKYHQGVKSFKCSHCPSAFIETRGLNNHLRRTHNLTEEEIYKCHEN